MKRLITLALLSLFLVSGGAVAEEKTGLAKAMGQMQSSFEYLEQNIRNESLDQDNMLQIYQLIEAAKEAAGWIPGGVASLQGEARTRSLAAYQEALQAMVTDAEELAQMVKERKPAEDRYKQLMKVFSHQKSGHDQFGRSR